MRRVYIKNKRFLKNFTLLSLLVLAITALVICSMYMMSVRALEQEVKSMNQNTVKEVRACLESVLEQCNELAARLVTDANNKLFYTYSNPQYLVDNYNAEISNKLYTYGVACIDTIFLYAPRYEHMLGNDGLYYIPDERNNGESAADITWIDDIPDEERTVTRVYIRSKADRWPYYITLLKRYRSGTMDGVAAVNVDLEELYDYLIAGREDTIQLYMLDEQQRIVLQEKKKALYEEKDIVEELGMYRSQETFSMVDSKKGYAYAQAYSEKYGLTCVTVTHLGDYSRSLMQVQQRFLLAAFLAVLFAVTLAYMYSIKLVKPLQDILQLLKNPGDWKTDDVRYDEEVREIADQIISHLQTNSRLRQELDVRLDLLKDTQLLALQAQINPHFLFNTLNAISLMVECGYGDGKPAVKMLEDLADILRYSLSECENVRIQEEMVYVRKYISLMQYWYENFEVSIEVDELVEQYAIPKLVLQPLIENSLQHGISVRGTAHHGRLRISMSEMSYIYKNGRERLSVCIEIEDNGIGMDLECLEKIRKSMADHKDISQKHIGLSNVALRFYLLFYKEQEIILDSTFGVGTKIKIIFPAIVHAQNMKVGRKENELQI